MVSEMVMRWTGLTGGEGASVFHFENVSGTSEAQNAISAMRTFFTALTSMVPDEVRWDPAPEVRVLDEATGTLLASYPIVPGATIVAANTTGYNRAAGARIDWETNAIEGGRRLRGRTYLVPLGSDQYAASGNLGGSTVTALTTAATNLVTNLNAQSRSLRVWSRKNGVARTVSSPSVPLKGAILRSRRD